MESISASELRPLVSMDTATKFASMSEKRLRIGLETEDIEIHKIGRSSFIRRDDLVKFVNDRDNGRTKIKKQGVKVDRTWSPEKLGPRLPGNK